MKFLAFGLAQIILAMLYTLPGHTAAAPVINEIAWMGTAASANDEWLELYNPGESAVDLTGWKLAADDGVPSIDLKGAIGPKGYFLLERTSDDTVKGVAADQIYTGALSNSGEALSLKDASGAVIDRLTAWYAGANSPPATMIRLDAAKAGTDPASWATSTKAGAAADAKGAAIIGSPRLENEMPPAQPPANQGGDSNNQNQNTPPPQATAAPGAPVPLTPVKILVQPANTADRLDIDQISIPTKIALNLLAQTNGQAATVVWSFGDGASDRDATQVSHTYQYPGTYFITLELRGTGQVVRDQLEVFVYAGGVRLSEFLPNPSAADKGKEWLELENTGDFLVDLGGFTIEAGVTKLGKYTLPPHTYIAPGGYLVIPLAVAGLTLGNAEGKIKLSYPNGAAADAVSYADAPENQSAIRQDDRFVWSTKLTPGFSNVLNPTAPLTAAAATFTEVTASAPEPPRLASLMPAPTSASVAAAKLTSRVFGPAEDRRVSKTDSVVAALNAPDALQSLAFVALPAPLPPLSGQSQIIVPASADPAAAAGERSRAIVLIVSILVGGSMLYYAVLARR